MASIKTEIIKVDKISKYFKSKAVIQDISLSVKAGEVLGIMGPNGSGKTTLINLLLGLLTPDTGKITIFGKNLDDNLEYIHQRTNMVSTYRRLQDDLSIYDNLLTYSRLYGSSSPSTEVSRILKLLSLEDFVQQKRKLVTLSTGEHTRIMFAKALINRPRILYLDEPTASLDPSNTQKIRTIIDTIHHRDQTTMILATHNFEEAKTLCDRVCFIKKGKIIKTVSGKQVGRLVNLY